MEKPLKQGDIEAINIAIKENALGKLNKLLLKHKYYLGENVLMVAVRFNLINAVMYLFESGFSTKGWDRCISICFSIAAAKGHIELIPILMEKGAKINEPNMFRATPIEVAVHFKQYTFIKEILKRCPEAINKHGTAEEALRYALKKENYNMLTFMINEGIQLYTINKKGQSLLHSALQEDNTIST